MYVINRQVLRNRGNLSKLYYFFSFQFARFSGETLDSAFLDVNGHSSGVRACDDAKRARPIKNGRKRVCFLRRNGAAFLEYFLPCRVFGINLANLVIHQRARGV